MSIRYFKGTKEQFDKIKDTQEFYKVKDIYVNKEGAIYFVVEEKPIKRHKLFFIKKYDIIK